MTKTAGSGAESQTDVTGAITDVVYTANDGYYFPEDYSVAEVSGIKVTRDSYTQITVSGTPSADATITLTAPTAKTTPAAPTTAAATDCTTASNNDGKLTGVTTAMEYQKQGDTEWTAGTGSDITGLVPGTYYVRVKATDTTNASANQTLTIAAYQKEAAVVTKTPTEKTLTYNGQAQELVTAGTATGGEMQYALGTATEATKPYTTSIPTATDAGTYYVWYRVKGDPNHYDSEPRCVTVNIANALYTVTSVENWEHTIDYPNDIIITVKRNVADDITFSMYTGASVDGNGIPAGGSSVAQGSLILTLKGSYLDTLSTGTHKVTISFKDGSADATISIVNAPPAPTAAPTHVPKTGDGANLVLWIGLILLGFLGIIAFAGMAGRKHRNR